MLQRAACMATPYRPLVCRMLSILAVCLDRNYVMKAKRNRILVPVFILIAVLLCIITGRGRFTRILLVENSETTYNTSENPGPGDMNQLLISHGRVGENLPNIVFLMADDLGYGDVGYSRRTIKTPNLNQMAAGMNTVHLKRYYSGSPVCSPTRGSVLTGRNPNRYCIWRANIGLQRGDFEMPQKMPLPTSEISVADVLKKHGYHTAIFGKWHIGDLKKLSGGNEKWPVSHPGMHGFDRWLVTERSAPTTTINCGCFLDKSKCVKGHYNTTPPCTNYYTASTVDGSLEAYEERIEGDDSNFIVDMFETYLKDVLPTGKPFFVYLPFHTVHHPYVAANGYREMYESEGFNAKEVDYYGAITAMDAAIGRVRALLRQHNVSDNTMVWFTSDNGPERNSPGSTMGLRGIKRSLFEGGIRVPGLIEWPAVIKQNHVTDYPVVSNDLFPTVCDILGIPLSKCAANRSIDGESIMPLLTGQREKRGSNIKWAYPIPGDFNAKYDAAISGDHYKLHATYNKGKIQSARLYDLFTDQTEDQDLSRENPELVESMKAELHEWLQSVIWSATDGVGCLEWSKTPVHVTKHRISRLHQN